MSGLSRASTASEGSKFRTRVHSESHTFLGDITPSLFISPHVCARARATDHSARSTRKTRQIYRFERCLGRVNLSSRYTYVSVSVSLAWISSSLACPSALKESVLQEMSCSEFEERSTRQSNRKWEAKRPRETAVYRFASVRTLSSAKGRKCRENGYCSLPFSRLAAAFLSRRAR